MSNEPTVRLSPTQVSIWPKSKRQPEYFAPDIETMARLARHFMSGPPRDHPTRVYIKKPSERLLKALAPHLALQRVDPTGDIGRASWWKVVLSDETADLDPVHARRVNDYIARSLQDMFWKKDGQVFVDSAVPEEPASALIVPFNQGAREGRG